MTWLEEDTRVGEWGQICGDPCDMDKNSVPFTH